MAGFAFPGTPPSLIDGLMSGLATRYDLGSDQDVVGRLTGDRPVGRADFRTSLFAEMAEGDGILLEASPDGCIAWAGDALERWFAPTQLNSGVG